MNVSFYFVGLLSWFFSHFGSIAILPNSDVSGRPDKYRNASLHDVQKGVSHVAPI
jgi:hypothetical protein